MVPMVLYLSHVAHGSMFNQWRLYMRQYLSSGAPREFGTCTELKVEVVSLAHSEFAMESGEMAHSEFAI